MSATAPTTAPDPNADDARGGSRRRVAGLTRANTLLLVRNRLTLFYAVALPLLPLAFLPIGPRGDVAIGATIATVTVTMALLFPVYYSLLSLLVTRRDELVLKRLRTGETTDGELLTSLALPGCAIGVAVALLAVPLGLALGQPVPTNPVVYVAAVVVGVLLLVALAVWTAAWTRNAEAAQMTSLPVFLLVSIGFSAAGLPEDVRRWVDLTPGAAVDTLVRIGWYGESRDGAVDLTASWGAAAQPLLVLAAWTALAAWLGLRSMRWEPRT